MAGLTFSVFNYNFLNVSSILCPKIQFDLLSGSGNFPPAGVKRGLAEILVTCLVGKVRRTWSKAGGGRMVSPQPPTVVPADTGRLEISLSRS